MLKWWSWRESKNHTFCNKINKLICNVRILCESYLVFICSNKERLSDELLSTPLNHFNKINLGVASARDDDMGRAYEYLIKRFADKANKKAGEFYTPRTIVRLMVNRLQPFHK